MLWLEIALYVERYRSGRWVAKSHLRAVRQVPAGFAQRYFLQASWDLTTWSVLLNVVAPAASSRGSLQALCQLTNMQ